MWRDFPGKYTYNKPAETAKLEEIKQTFNIDLPEELESLLKETDGINDEFGCHLIWSADRIIDENKELRNSEIFKDLYMPFDCLLFIADAGNGDLFGYSILNGSIQRDDIYVWNHEDDSRTWVAPTLKQFIEWWIDGKILI
ncbi:MULTISPECIES: SMI1/KNR4 family protein [Bacillus]|uniref:SMI1/KNR4 family protein n=1 Tax=Bacillus glycinifermentans TaxID=1664069 RepID=A0AAJ3YWX9_9BACI|nr:MULTISPECIES: SMI1/KNR4 family protein [Bacillus]KKB73203.1 cell wall assembly protein [Bacillus sp. TH008]MBU8788999.1 SMI1/KNR4 family protein [Bacillus glycinifermentans]NUJ19530.1 SMI1/KNR4 family protein [Bacillus glycinifermentans]QAT63530.1 SMI1/KNR4 family protein [Bacillus glycinifermentans]WKB77396.1 SMI1/KNR4 family protein [Bacillus glycinifermentans]